MIVVATAVLVGALLGAGLTIGVVSARSQEDSASENTTQPASQTQLASAVAFEAPVPPANVATTRLAVVAPGTAQDRSFTQSMTDATADLLDSGEIAEVVLVENITPDQAEAQLRELAAGDVDLVIAHSSTYQAAVFAVASDHPTVLFAVAIGTDDPTPAPNVFTYTVSAEQGGFLLGVISAQTSPVDTVGVIGSVDVGVSGHFVDGFHNGAHYERDDLRVLISYAGSNADPAALDAAATTLIDDGAGAIAGHGHTFDDTIRLAADRDVVWLGNQTNPADVSPTTVTAAQVYDWTVVLKPIIVDLDAGSFDGRHLVANLGNGGVSIDYNPQQPLPPETTARVEELTAEILTGALDPLAP